LGSGSVHLKLLNRIDAHQLPGCIPQAFHAEDMPRKFKFHAMHLVSGQSSMLKNATCILKMPNQHWWKNLDSDRPNKMAIIGQYMGIKRS